MVSIRVIDEEIFPIVIRMKVTSEQEKFVSPNTVSLAQAWLYRNDARPYAIMKDEIAVGFVMLDWDEDERTVGIWRFMIDAEYQGKGYGKAALLAVLEMIRVEGKFDLCYLEYAEENTVARNLYASVGFKENGKIENGEIVMTMPLTDEPKVGILIADEEDLEEFEELFSSIRKHGLKIPEEFKTIEELSDLVTNRKILRLTLMGDTIGLSDGTQICIAPEYDKYRDEAIAKAKEYTELAAK